jgi:plasmid maintenance system antidote protein VapI
LSAVMTPWQKVAARFGLKPAHLAMALGRHRSKISRALKDEKGLISGRDQELIIKTAETLNVNVTPEDMMPARHD